jgi:hypothetical protein
VKKSTQDTQAKLQALERDHTQHRADGAFDKAAAVREHQANLMFDRHHLLRRAAEYSAGAGDDWIVHVHLLLRERRLHEVDAARANAVAAYTRALDVDPDHPNGTAWKGKRDLAAAEG